MARRRFRRSRGIVKPRGLHWIGVPNSGFITLDSSNPVSSDFFEMIKADDIQPQGATPMEADQLTLMAIRGTIDWRGIALNLDPDRGIAVQWSVGIFMSAHEALGNLDNVDFFSEAGLTDLDWLWLDHYSSTITEGFTPDWNWNIDLHVPLHIKARRRMRATDALFFVYTGVASSAMGIGEGIDLEYFLQCRCLIKV